MSYTDADTGELVETPIELIRADIAELDEESIIHLFPTPAQALGALIMARKVIARAPGALRGAKQKLRAAERNLRVATALVTMELAETKPGLSVTERSKIAITDDRVKTASDAVDAAWVELEYARDWEKALARDVQILRSINANFRAEVRS